MKVGQTLVSKESGHRFKILSINKVTVTCENEHGVVTDLHLKQVLRGFRVDTSKR